MSSLSKAFVQSKWNGSRNGCSQRQRWLFKRKSVVFYDLLVSR